MILVWHWVGETLEGRRLDRTGWTWCPLKSKQTAPFKSGFLSCSRHWVGREAGINHDPLSNAGSRMLSSAVRMAAKLPPPAPQSLSVAHTCYQTTHSSTAGYGTARHGRHMATAALVRGQTVVIEDALSRYPICICTHISDPTPQLCSIALLRDPRCPGRWVDHNAVSRAHVRRGLSVAPQRSTPDNARVQRVQLLTHPSTAGHREGNERPAQPASQRRKCMRTPQQPWDRSDQTSGHEVGVPRGSGLRGRDSRLNPGFTPAAKLISCLGAYLDAYLGAYLGACVPRPSLGRCTYL